MAHFAQLDNNNIVLQVVVISNDDLIDENGIEQEHLGLQVCRNIYGSDTNWIQTSYNGNFRRRYAGIGFRYDETLDAFIEPSPFPSWVLDGNADWQAPTPAPDCADHAHMWDEATLAWSACPEPTE